MWDPPVLTCVEKPWYVQHFPNLQKCFFGFDEKLTNEILAEFLLFNPQLQELGIDACDYISPIILKNIGTYATNLHSLEIIWYDDRVINERVLHLKTLRNLREWKVGGELSLELLMNMFVNNNMPICSLHHTLMPEETAQNLPTLKTLKNLFVSRFDSDGDICDDILINLTRAQTALESIRTGPSDIVTMQAITKILELGKSLTNIEFGSDSELDLSTYNAILNLANNRVKVKLVIDEVDVPKEVLDTNRKWIDITSKQEYLTWHLNRIKSN